MQHLTETRYNACVSSICTNKPLCPSPSPPAFSMRIRLRSLAPSFCIQQTAHHPSSQHQSPIPSAMTPTNAISSLGTSRLKATAQLADQTLACTLGSPSRQGFHMAFPLHSAALSAGAVNGRCTCVPSSGSIYQSHTEQAVSLLCFCLGRKHTSPLCIASV